MDAPERSNRFLRLKIKDKKTTDENSVNITRRLYYYARSVVFAAVPARCQYAPDF